MPKTINIFFGSISDTISELKSDINKKNKEYLNNLKIIQLHQYLCSQLLQSTDILSISTENVHNMLTALSYDEYWNTLVNIYLDKKETSSNINEDVMTEFEAQMGEDMQNMGYDKDSIYILVYLFLEIVSLGGEYILNYNDSENSLIYKILVSEYSYIQTYKEKNDSLKIDIDKYNKLITDIINEVFIDKSMIVYPSTMINKVNSLYETIKLSIEEIKNKNKDNQDVQDVDIKTIEDITEYPDLSTSTSEYKLNVEGSYFEKYELANGQHSELIPGTITIMDKNNNVIKTITEFKNGIKNPEWLDVNVEFYNHTYQHYIKSNSKWSNIYKDIVIVNNPPIGTKIEITCIWTYMYNGEQLKYFEPITENIIKIIS